MLPGLESGEGDGIVERIGHGDRNGLDIRVGYELFVISIDMGDVERARQVFATLLIKASNGHDFDPGILGKPLEVQQAHAATDDPYVDHA